MARDTRTVTDSAARTRRIVALVAALIGGYLLTVGADPTSSARSAFIALIAGTLLFLVTLFFLQRYYRPGVDDITSDEIGRTSEWKVARFLRRARDAAPFYLGLRLFLGFEWINAGWHKVRDDAWMDGGSALRASWERAVAIPQTGAPRITYPAYRSFIQYMLDREWYDWFAKLISVGELLVGLGLLFGGLTAFAAFFGLLLNFNFIYAGSTSSNPTLIMLEALIIFGWRPAGWWGLDRFLLPLLGTPWGRRREERPASRAQPQV